MYHRNFRGILLELFEEEVTHISLQKAVENISLITVGIKPNHLPYSIWQLTEHIRITQKDILEYSFNPKYKSMNWPKDFWPKEIAPESESQWKTSVDEIQKDREKMIQCIKDPSVDLLKPFNGDISKNIFREALLLLDHSSYHTGEIIVLRRLLEDWNRA